MRTQRERQLTQRPRLTGARDAVASQPRRRLVVPDLERDDAALPQPPQTLVMRRLLPEESLDRRLAGRDSRVVVLREADERVNEQAGRAAVAARTWRSPGRLGNLRQPDAFAEPGGEQRGGERVDVRLARERAVQRLQAPGG